MSLRDVRELVAQYEGTPDYFNLDSRAMNLTIGDLRMLLCCADECAERHFTEFDRTEYLGHLIRAHCTWPGG